MKFLSLLGLIAAALLMGAAAAYAQQQDLAAGGAEFKLLQDMITGNLGYGIGLTVALIGLFIIIRGNFGGGVTMLILGVLITLAPNVFMMVRTITCPVAQALGGACGGTD
jgi:hypothetical protein